MNAPITKFSAVLVLVFTDNTDRLQRPDGAVHVPRAKQVLERLVLDRSIAGFFDGHPRQRLGVCDCGLR